MFARSTLLLPIVIFGLALIASGCVLPTPVASIPRPTVQVVTFPTYNAFSDPFGYCAAVGTIDSPDARYMGPAVPDSVIDGFKKAAGLQGSTEPVDMFRHSTIWRCMQGRVYACNYGANLPCDAKADTNKTPTSDMLDFCVNNSDANTIPMDVVGHATIYDWRCKGTKPEIHGQIDLPDPRGYLSRIWYPLSTQP